VSTVTRHAWAGLELEVDSTIPGLPVSPSSASPDVRIRLGEEPGAPGMPDDAERRIRYLRPGRTTADAPEMILWELSGGAHLCLEYPTVARFVVDRLGTRVWGAWHRPWTFEHAMLYLTGPVLSFVLLLRGITSLHASAIAIGEFAVALVGPAGIGKSSAAAFFAQLGHPVLSDDTAPLLERNGTIAIQPTSPVMRLWPDTAMRLYGDGDSLPPLSPRLDKRRLDLEGRGLRFQGDPLPLAAVYLLSPGTEPSIVEAVTASESMLSLIANTYHVHLFDSAVRARQFRILGRLATEIPIRRVRGRGSLARLPALCRAILDDIGRLPRPASTASGAPAGR
jgi:hypothetical protein